MSRNRFHRFRVLVAALAVLLTGLSLLQPASASQFKKSATDVTVVLAFAPGTAQQSWVLPDSAKSQLVTARQDIARAQQILLTGYSAPAAGTAAGELALKRTAAVAAYLARFAPTATVQQVSGGLASGSTTPQDGNRVSVRLTPTPGLLWVQNFNEPRGSVVDGSSLWGLHGNGSSELGLPTYGTGEIEFNDPNFATTDGAGNLRIHTVRDSNLWRSSRIWTQGRVNFQYGRLEIRAKLPQGAYNWPAIWMLGSDYQPPNGAFGTVQWPASGELDIMEGLGANSVVQGTLHGSAAGGGDWLGGAGVTAVAPLSNISAGYHVWSIDWLPNQISFAMDGVTYATDTFNGQAVTQTLANNQKRVIDAAGNWPFNQPFFLIFNNAVWPGSNQANGTNSDFLIDWVKYSTLNGFGRVN